MFSCLIIAGKRIFRILKSLTFMVMMFFSVGKRCEFYVSLGPR